MCSAEGRTQPLACFGQKHFRKVYALSFIYGQKHVKEVELARVIAGKAGVEFKAMDVSFIGNLGKNSLTDTTITMDEVKPADSFLIRLCRGGICSF